MNQSLLNSSCSFWQLSKEARTQIIQDTPKRSNWLLHLIRLDSGYWFFDRPDLNTYKELLVGGTELIIDNYYQYHLGEEPSTGSSLNVLVSTEELPHNDGLLVRQGAQADDGSANYYDWHSQLEGWLCGWTQVIWGYAPELIHLQIIED